MAGVVIRVRVKSPACSSLRVSTFFLCSSFRVSCFVPLTRLLSFYLRVCKNRETTERERRSFIAVNFMLHFPFLFVRERLSRPARVVRAKLTE